MKEFSLKFIDIMIGIVLGLGFQWWPNLGGVWQYVAFAFVYLDIIDYWIDYSPSLKKFPPKREIDLIIDVAIMFAVFLYIYSAQLTVVYFLGAFALFRLFDFFWFWRVRSQYQPTHTDKLFIDTWLRFDIIEMVFALGLITITAFTSLSPSLSLIVLIIFIIFRIFMRIIASFRYKKVYFA